MRLADNSPPSFHNGGDIHFGPDGYLYMSSGDGGQESGTHWLAECLWKKPNDTTSTSCDNSATEPQYFLRGKMLRIDVDNRGEIAGEEMCGAATGEPAEYSIPADNPFVATSHTCDEIYLWGFRNPWRWSFDRKTGDMWIGDVGQDHWEEINLRTAGSSDPIYYGWHCMEGTSVFNSSQVCTPPLQPNVLPLIEYDHATGSRCAVTGGYRYRGPITEFQGMYVFADSCSSEIFFAKPDASHTLDVHRVAQRSERIRHVFGIRRGRGRQSLHRRHRAQQGLPLPLRRGVRDACRHAGRGCARLDRTGHAADRQRRRHDRVHGHAGCELPDRRCHRLWRNAGRQRVHDGAGDGGLRSRCDVRASILPM